MSDLIIYGPPQSTYVRSTRMACVEKGIDYRVEPIEFGGELHMEMHPFGKIPVMRHGDFRLYETSAICRYVDQGFDGPPLMPADPQAAALAEQFVSCFSCYLYDDLIRRYVLQYIFPKGDDGQPDRWVIDAALQDIRRDLAVLDAAYGERTWLAGEALSIPDLLVAPPLHYVAQMPEGDELFAPHDNLKRARAALEARDSFIQTEPPPPQADAA